MTPTELETYVRQRYNAVGDSFFPPALMYNYFYLGQMELATKAKCIKNTYTTVSAVGQRQYDFPSKTVEIRRVEYDGKRIKPNDFIADDTMTGNNPGDTTTGVPINYQIFAQNIYLRPIPSVAALEIKIYSYDEPQAVTAVATLDVPNHYHFALADYALGCMFGQDKNHLMARFHFDKWDAHVLSAIALEESKRSSDEFPVVKDWATINDGSGLY